MRINCFCTAQCSSLHMHGVPRLQTRCVSQKRPQRCLQLQPCAAHNPKGPMSWQRAAHYAMAQATPRIRGSCTCSIGVQAQHGTASRSRLRPWRSLDVGVGALDAGLGGVDGGAVGVQAAVRGAAPHSGQSVIVRSLCESILGRMLQFHVDGMACGMGVGCCNPNVNASSACMSYL
jgi:hypothetical protein